MGSKMLPSAVLTVALAVLIFASGCASPSNCPTCGTTSNGSVGIVDIMAVPNANPTGPNGPFTSFDIGWVDMATRRYYISDRVHSAVDVYDTVDDISVEVISPAAFASGIPCAVGILAANPFLATDPITGSPPPSDPLFCSGGFFGGFGGVNCCTGRGSGQNPLSSPDGVATSSNGKTLFVGNGDSAVVVFDVTTRPPTVIGDIPTGFSPTYGGTDGIGTCIRSGMGCGDFRADEMAFDPKDNILLVSNGDPAVPFVTLIAVSTPTACGVTQNCILGQIFFDGLGAASTAACPTTSGIPTRLLCAHGPIGPSGIGGSAFNPNTGHFLVTVTQNDSNPADGEIMEINPLATTGPGLIVHEFQLTGLGCQAASVVMGPGTNALVGCANHDTVTFPPNEIIMNGTTGSIITIIPFVGGVDETWYNPGENRYYTASRDMPNGPMLGVIDAGKNLWLQSVPTGSNAHSVAVDSINNHIFVPLQPSGSCRDQSANGCIAVYAAQ